MPPLLNARARLLLKAATPTLRTHHLSAGSPNNTPPPTRCALASAGCAPWVLGSVACSLPFAAASQGHCRPSPQASCALAGLRVQAKKGATAGCTGPEECLSGVCNTNQCATSAIGDGCVVLADCSAGYCDTDASPAVCTVMCSRAEQQGHAAVALWPRPLPSLPFMFREACCPTLVNCLVSPSLGARVGPGLPAKPAPCHTAQLASRHHVPGRPCKRRQGLGAVSRGVPGLTACNRAALVRPPPPAPPFGFWAALPAAFLSYTAQGLCKS